LTDVRKHKTRNRRDLSDVTGTCPS
jgi:hypothetical protein